MVLFAFIRLHSRPKQVFDHESPSVGQKDLRQVQGDPSRRRGAGHLRQPETQTEAGI